MKDTQVALAVEIETAVNGLGTDYSRKANGPGAGFANASRNAHLMRVAGLILRDRLHRSLMKVECILSQPAQGTHAEIFWVKEARQKLGKSAPIGKMGKTEVPPG